MVAWHMWFDTAITWRAPVIEGQLTRHDVRNDVRLAHGQPPHRIRRDLLFIFVEVFGRIEAILKLIRTIEDKIFIAEYIHYVRRCRSGEKQRRTGSGVDDPMHDIHRY